MSDDSADDVALDPIAGAPPDGLPSADAVIKSIRGASQRELGAENLSQLRIEEDFRSDYVRAGREFEHLNGLRAHYKHKGRWSCFIMGLMGAMVLFQSAVITLVGFHIWSFTDYPWLLPALLVQNFAQIVGLALFVVKALFRDVGGGFGSGRGDGPQ